MDIQELPINFRNALARNEAARTQFNKLPNKQRQVVINKTRKINSNYEMDCFVNYFSNGSLGIWFKAQDIPCLFFAIWFRHDNPQNRIFEYSYHQQNNEQDTYHLFFQDNLLFHTEKCCRQTIAFPYPHTPLQVYDRFSILSYQTEHFLHRLYTQQIPLYAFLYRQYLKQ